MKSASIEELEGQIEKTRRELDQTLNALRSKLSPRYQLQQACCWSIDHPARALAAATVITGALCFGVIRLKPPA